MNPTAKARAAQELQFPTHDGEALFYRYWPAITKNRRGAVLLFHRGHEHSARMAHLVDELELPDFDFYAWDARGHGHSPGPLGYSPSFASSVRDVQAFVQHLVRAHQLREEEMHVVAQSVGAVLIATWVHDYAPRLRGLTLASPAFKIRLYVPFARPGLALLYRLHGLFYVNSYVKAKLLSHDKERIASYDSDPLIAKPIAVNVLLELNDAAQRVVHDANAITLPVQLLISGADWVVDKKPQHKFFERLGSNVKSKIELPGFFHDTLGERDRGPVLDQVRTFILNGFAQAPQPVDRREAHLQGETAEEARALAHPLSLASPRGLAWACVRAGLRAGARWSEGLRLGQTSGFDSGSTLDYVYQHRPQGRSRFGRLVDRYYLDSIGWRGIRQRKIHLEELLALAMQALNQQGREIHLLDIAAGHGRYVLDAVRASPVPVHSVLLRDYSELNIKQGQALIEARGLSDRARFVHADAFDRASLATVRPRPTLSVVSGLYELFSDNSQVRRSLAGLADAMEAGACLVYTNQPWHPQLEMIARALTSHRQGQAWVMRRRSQVEMDQLVAEAGFKKVDQRVDAWGIFTVSLAVRDPL